VRVNVDALEPFREPIVAVRITSAREITGHNPNVGETTADVQQMRIESSDVLRKLVAFEGGLFSDSDPSMRLATAILYNGSHYVVLLRQSSNFLILNTAPAPVYTVLSPHPNNDMADNDDRRPVILADRRQVAADPCILQTCVPNSEDVCRLRGVQADHLLWGELP
jgi:hypothetical protein